MEYTSQEDLDIFLQTYTTRRCEIHFNRFEKKGAIFNDLAIGYHTSLMEKELDELWVIFEDKKNVLNLVALNEKDGMNNDILMIIYNKLVSAKGNKKYKGIIDKIGYCINRLEIITSIIKA